MLTDDVPRLRHDAARRSPARRHHLLGADKLAVARLLDQLGVGFIEGGWPGAMPKDTEFFARAADGELVLKNATLVAFGATRKAGVRVRGRPAGARTLDSRAPVVTLGRQVRRLACRAGPAHDARREPRDGARHRGFLRGEGRRVFLDCEHFFDGYRHDPDYGVRVLDAAADGRR